jgi:hypothetical protein
MHLTIHYNHATTGMLATNVIPQIHTFSTPLFTALPVNTVPLYVESPVLDDPLLPLVDVPKPPTETMTPPRPLAVVVLLPRYALKASVVVPPITTDDPSVWSDTTVPDTVISGPPATSVCEPEATTYSGVLRKAPMACVEPPTMTEDPPGWRENTVPETVMGAPPAESVCEPIKRVGAAVGVAMACVLPPATIVAPFGARETGVPETVIWPPGVRVCVPITKLDDESAVMVELPMVTTAGGEVFGFEGLTTTPPALELEVPGSNTIGEVEGDGFAGSTTDGEVDGDGFAGSTTDGEVDGDGSAGSITDGEVDGDGSADGSVLVGSVGGVVGINVEVSVGEAMGSVADPGEAGSVVEATGAGLVIGSAVGVVDVDVKGSRPP